MAKKKEITELVNDEQTLSAVESEICIPLYKYEVGDEVFVMEDNKVKSFTIAKRIIVTRLDNDGKIQNDVLYDESNWASLKGQYNEKFLYPTKKALLESL